MRFEGQIAVVTGGASGIGKGISRRLASEGATVVIVNRRKDVAAEAVAEFEEAGLSVSAIQTDVAELAEVQAMMKTVIDSYGKIDILVNNAGIARDGLLMRMKPEDWDRVIAVNLTGAFNCIKTASRAMVKARRGNIINISSVVGVMGNAGQANYAAAKAGILGLTKALAREFAPWQIRVNAVAPGYIRTDMTASMTAEQVTAFISTVPLNREGTVDDVAAVVAFLASDDASYITGNTVHVDGGMAM